MAQGEPGFHRGSAHVCYKLHGQSEASEGKPMPQPLFDWQEILIIVAVSLVIAASVFVFFFVGPHQPKE